MSSIDEPQARNARRQRAEEPAGSLLNAFDLLERDDELAAIDALISVVPGGGRLLVIEGPFGIGKTSLIAEAKSRAQEAGFQVLGARGSELERASPTGSSDSSSSPTSPAWARRGGPSCSGALPRSRPRCSSPRSSAPSPWQTRRWRCCTACTG